MIRFKKMLKKDRYGVVRGSIAIGVLLLVCMYLFIHTIFNTNIAAEKERAMFAASTTAASIEQLITGKEMYLRGLAESIGPDGGGAIDALNRIKNDVSFTDAVFVQGDMMLHADGSRSVSETNHSERQEICIQENSIVFNVPSANDGYIQARIDTARLEEILSSAFESSYGFIVYDAPTGNYLINRSFLGSTGYYDALLEINENGQVGALLNSENSQARIRQDGIFYIAQQKCTIMNWSIALVLPEEVIEESLPGQKFFQIFAVVAAIVFIAILSGITIFAQRRMHISNSNAVRAMNSGEKMMHVVAQDSRMLLFVYNRIQDQLLACYDGLGLFSSLPEGMRYVRSLSDMATICGVSEAELVNMQAELSEIQSGAELEFYVHSASENRDERMLRIAFYASQDDEKNLIGSICDRTQELEFRDRAELERVFQASMQHKATSIWQINISRNRWNKLYSTRNSYAVQLFHGKNTERDYNSDLGSELKKLVHPQDYDAFEGNMSIVNIASMYRSGKTDFIQDYRVCTNQNGEYAWHRMRVRIWMNPETSDILANLYVFNVDAEKQAEQERGERKRILGQALTAIGGLYSGLYYVDLINDLSYTAKSLGGDWEPQLCASYRESFEKYIQNTVHRDDQQEFRSLISAYNLRREMKEGSHSRRLEFRRRIDGNNYGKAYILVQPALFENGDVKEVVLAIRYYEHKNEL